MENFNILIVKLFIFASFLLGATVAFQKVVQNENTDTSNETQEREDKELSRESLEESNSLENNSTFSEAQEMMKDESVRRIESDVEIVKPIILDETHMEVSSNVTSNEVVKDEIKSIFQEETTGDKDKTEVVTDDMVKCDEQPKPEVEETSNVAEMNEKTIEVGQQEVTEKVVEEVTKRETEVDEKITEGAEKVTEVVPEPESKDENENRVEDGNKTDNENTEDENIERTTESPKSTVPEVEEELAVKTTEEPLQVTEVSEEIPKVEMITDYDDNETIPEPVASASFQRIYTAPAIGVNESAAILASIFIAIGAIGYAVLMIWRKLLERRYGNSEQLISEDDFYDVSDLRNFDV